MRRSGRALRRGTARVLMLLVLGLLAAPAPAVPPTHGAGIPETGRDSPEFDRFMESFTPLAEEIRADTGTVAFLRVVYQRHGVLELTASAAWMGRKRMQREAELASIFKLWTAAVGEGYSASVDVYDENGSLLMSMMR